MDSLFTSRSIILVRAAYHSRPGGPGALVKVALCDAEKGDVARMAGATQKAREFYEPAIRESQLPGHPGVDDKDLWLAAADG